MRIGLTVETMYMVADKERGKFGGVDVEVVFDRDVFEVVKKMCCDYD